MQQIKRRTNIGSEQSEDGDDPCKLEEDDFDRLSSTTSKKPRRQIVWFNVIAFLILHTIALGGLYVILAGTCKFYTLVWGFLLYLVGGFGITAGAHRLWAHKSYKAKWPLRVFLCICQSVAFQNAIFEWARDHRVHHKFTESDADPHNSKRGFFFSHMGWLMVKKHPDVITKGKRVDMKDLYQDPVVMFQKKHYLTFLLVFWFLIPFCIPLFVWNETILAALTIPVVLRYVVTLHATWLVNSLAHYWGMRPYNKDITPAENPFVSLNALGEGWHNYHHTFPQDYATGEFGWRINPTTIFIDLMAKIGQVYDRKRISPEIILARKNRTGYQ